MTINLETVATASAISAVMMAGFRFIWQADFQKALAKANEELLKNINGT